MKMRRAVRAIIALSAVVGIASCDSGTIRFARLIRGAVTECSAIDSRIEDRIAYWEQQPNVRERESGSLHWQDEARDLPKKFPGLLVKVRESSVADIQVERTMGRAESIRVAKWRSVGSNEEWFFTTALGCNCGTVTFSDGEILLAASMPFATVPPNTLAAFLGVDELSRAPRVFIDNWGLD